MAISVAWSSSSFTRKREVLLTQGRLKIFISIFESGLSLAAFEFVLKNATDGRVSQDDFLQAYGFTKPE